MGNGLQNLFTQIFPGFYYPLLVAGWSKMNSLRRECKQVLMPTIATSDTGKAVMQNVAVKIAINHLPHIGAEEAVLSRNKIPRRQILPCVT
jgi:hypothetical protein